MLTKYWYIFARIFIWYT